MFNDHIATMKAKGRRFAGLCIRKLVTRNSDFMLRVFNTYVLPSMLYASAVWSPRLRFEMDALEAVQRQCTRRIMEIRHMINGQRLYTMLHLSVESACMTADLVLAYKLVRGMLGITAAEASLHLGSGTMRASGILLQQHHVAVTSPHKNSSFVFRCYGRTVPHNIMQCANLKKLRQLLMIADFAFFS